ncbi:hypothetical protein [Staphylococcus marylandisciuri]|uniref:hypothetical protein n=1 Tax=Staphylococcus marylandisciuri TaxID=2981529 RepID=UPI0021D0F415|nr:hypothetical protein [Staphylococcus marylandisciuri]
MRVSIDNIARGTPFIGFQEHRNFMFQSLKSTSAFSLNRTTKKALADCEMKSQQALYFNI